MQHYWKLQFIYHSNSTFFIGLDVCLKFRPPSHNRQEFHLFKENSILSFFYCCQRSLQSTELQKGTQYRFIRRSMYSPLHGVHSPVTVTYCSHCRSAEIFSGILSLCCCYWNKLSFRTPLRNVFWPFYIEDKVWLPSYDLKYRIFGIN